MSKFGTFRLTSIINVDNLRNCSLIALLLNLLKKKGISYSAVVDAPRWVLSSLNLYDVILKKILLIITEIIFINLNCFQNKEMETLFQKLWDTK